MRLWICGAISTALLACPPPKAIEKSDAGEVSSFEVDVTAPTVIAFNPEHGTSSVDRRKPLKITFSEAIDPASLPGEAIQLKEDGELITVFLGLEQGKSVSVQPARTLRMLADLELTVGQGIRDLAGNSLQEARTIRLKTADGVWSPPEEIYADRDPGFTGDLVADTDVMEISSWCSKGHWISKRPAVRGGLLCTRGVSRALQVSSRCRSSPQVRQGEPSVPPWISIYQGVGC